MAEVLRDDVGETREALAASPVSVDGGKLPPRGHEIAEFGLGDAARVLGLHSFAHELLRPAFYMKSQFVVDVLLDGTAGHARGTADSRDPWLVRHRHPPTWWRSGHERVPRRSAPGASIPPASRRGRGR